jgi:uncharacterized protein
MKRLYLSRFAHFFYKEIAEGDVALYHSIKMSVIFLDYKTAKDLESTYEGRSFAEFCEIFSNNNLTESRKLIRKMIAAGFLINDKKKDDDLLKSIVFNIPNPYPHILYLMMVDGCNLACRYCFESMNQGNVTCEYKKMPEEIIEKALNRYVDLINANPKLFPKEKTIIFYGGEPLINFPGIVFALEKIKSMQKAGKIPKKLKLILISNGTLINNEQARILKKYKVNVSISLDGNEKQNENRVFSNGIPAFKKIMRGFKICQNLGLNTSISCTISNSNINEVNAVVSEILKNKVYYLGFNILLGETSSEYHRKAANFILDAYNIFKENGVFEDRMHRKIESFCKKRPMLFDCAAAGGNQLVVSPEGSIGICHGFFNERKYFAESVFNSNNPLKNPIWQEWNKRTPFNMKECLNCEAIAVCGGGCLMNAEKVYGSIWKVDESHCEHSLQSLNWLIWDLHKSLLTVADV